AARAGRLRGAHPGAVPDRPVRVVVLLLRRRAGPARQRLPNALAVRQLPGPQQPGADSDPGGAHDLLAGRRAAVPDPERGMARGDGPAGHRPGPDRGAGAAPGGAGDPAVAAAAERTAA